MSQFINLSEQKNQTFEGVFISFAKRELELKASEKKFYNMVVFESGQELILFHAVLINLLKDAVRAGKIKAGSRLQVIQGEKKESGKSAGQSYYEYTLFIDGERFNGNLVALSLDDFLSDV